MPNSAKKSFNFEIVSKDKHSKARVGRIFTAHGMVDTPAFVPVGTQATIKSLTPHDLENIGVQILFGNTYHLHLRPGEDVIERFGGLGKFMSFKGVTMTDSGGYQVFSLAREKRFGLKTINISENTNRKLVKITEDGVEFQSHLDGSRHFFTPEQSISIQKKLGADIILAFDDCPPYPITYASARAAMERTHRWLIRSIEAYKKLNGKFDQAIYAIVQGSIFEDLRRLSAKFIANSDANGIAIGGVAVGEGKEEMVKSVQWVQSELPDEKVKHLLGVGDVDDIFTIIGLGIDTFDCVTPTRLGRVGHIFISPPEGNLNNRFRFDIANSSYASSTLPLNNNCDCYTCSHYTRGYINHLFKAKELLAYRLATYHNVYFIINLVKKIRESILDGQFSSLTKEWLK